MIMCRDTKRAVEHHPDGGISHPMAHRQRRIVEQCRLRPDHDGCHLRTQVVHRAPRLGRRQHNCRLCGVCTAPIHEAVCALRPLQTYIRTFLLLKSHKRPVQCAGFLFHHAGHDLHTCLAKHPDAPAGHFGERVETSHHNTRNMFLHDQLCTRGRLAVMRARLQTHVERCFPEKRLITNRGYRIHLGMCLAVLAVVTLSYYLSIVNDHCPNHRIGSNASGSAACQSYAACHVFTVCFNHCLCRINCFYPTFAPKEIS